MRLSLSVASLKYTLIGVLYGLILILLKPQEPAVFLVWIVSVVMMILRLRFGRYKQWLVLDFVVITLFVVLLDASVVFYMPLVLLLAFSVTPFVLLTLFVLWFAFAFMDEALLVLFSFASLTTVLLLFWAKEKEVLKQHSDAYRESVYHLEQEKQMLLKEQVALSRESVLIERDRIAHTLHDDLGHELTGALMAIRALEVEQAHLKSSEVFQAIKGRVEKSVKSLKDTVYSMKPSELISFERFKDTLRAFTAVRVETHYEGDLASLDPLHWQVLEMVLKEGLTNVLKHADATVIKLTLGVEGRVVKFLLENDKPRTQGNAKGTGLHYMRKRVEALGGVQSVNVGYMFTLRVTLPKTLKG